jgi:feruloyl esterase
MVRSCTDLLPVDNGTSGDGTFAISNSETQIDFGYRAVHLTTVYSKKILAVSCQFPLRPGLQQCADTTRRNSSQAYYGRQQDYSYWLGCSSGGKQGLKEVQAYPNDYDGVVAGAAAQ